MPESPLQRIVPQRPRSFQSVTIPSVPLPLACTVRTCRQPLRRESQRFVCNRGHSYDVARTGYVNLLQPQDRRSREPGDARATVEARVELEKAGIGAALTRAVAGRVEGLSLGPGAVLVELGCGTGRALATVAASGAYAAVGVDLSAAAVTYAARHWQEPTWVVANADRGLPLVDRGVNVVLSLHARRNPAEAARVLAPGGVLIVAVPGADDLIELRAEVQGEGVRRSRIDQVIAEHAPFFHVRERFSVHEQRHFDGGLLRQLLLTTYRGARTSEARRIEALTSLDLTLSSDACVLSASDGG
jgi:23S rRNA (guanine745-N1)-methyltransferase